MDNKEFAAAMWSLDPSAIEDSKGIIGILTFEGDRSVQLEIPAGVLLDWPKIPIEGGYMQSHTVEGLHADQVYGFSQKGDYYLLRDVFSPGPGMSCPGMECQTLRGSSLFVSRKILISNPVVRSITVKVPGLREWLGIVPFEVSTRLENNRFSGISFNFEVENANSITLFENKEIKIAIDMRSTHKGGPIPAFSFDFETDCDLTLSFKGEGLDFDNAMKIWVHPAVSFLAFCMGFKYSIDALSIETVEGIKADYFAPFVGTPGIPNSAQLRSMPFPYSAISKKIDSMISNWYGFDDYLQNSATLLTSLMNKWNMPLDMLFLASAQALEAASRSGVDECEISDEDLEKHLAAIKGSNLGSRTKKWARYKLKHAKWKSADYLAKSLIEKLGEFATYTVPDIDRFLKDHRINRDAYTHRRSLNEGENLSNEELYCNMEATQLLTYGSIAINLGLDIDEIVKCFQDSRYRWNSFYRVSKQYAIE